MTVPMPKDNEVDEKVVAFAVVVDGEPDYANVHKWACESEAGVYGDGPIVTIEPLTYAATVAELRADRDSWREQAADRLREWDKLRVEVAENEAVINVWRRRCEAAERRVGELLDVVKYAVGNPEFNSQQFVYMCKSALANSATLTGADPT